VANTLGVLPGALRDSAGPYEDLAARLAAEQSKIGGVSGTSGACGNGALGGALSSFCSRWSSDVARQSVAMQDMGQAVARTADGLEAADASGAGTIAPVSAPLTSGGTGQIR
jgi:uncharacterized protein YukE